MGRIHAVCFDLDGTLQGGDKLELNARLYEISKRVGLGLSETEIMQIGASTPDYREMRTKMVQRGNEIHQGRGFTENEFSAVNLEVTGMFDHLLYLEEGAIDTLNYLQRERYKLALMTTRGGISLPRLLDRHEINHYFGKAVINRDSCNERKPHPRPLLLGLEILGVKPSNAAYVGDSQRDDVGAANNAGMVSILKSPHLPGADSDLPMPHHHIKALTELQYFLHLIY